MNNNLYNLGFAEGCAFAAMKDSFSKLDEVLGSRD